VEICRDLVRRHCRQHHATKVMTAAVEKRRKVVLEGPLSGGDSRVSSGDDRVAWSRDVSQRLFATQIDLRDIQSQSVILR
jgi:hypothetical protein